MRLASFRFETVETKKSLLFLRPCEGAWKLGKGGVVYGEFFMCARGYNFYPK